MGSQARIELVESCASTNDLAMAAVSSQAPSGSCWIADQQTAGRGRREVGGQRRAWYSPAGRNLYMSLLLRPQIEPARAAGLTLAAAVGVCAVLRARSGLQVGVKWPNDLYYGDRKLGGILTEASQHKGALAVVIGVGINVNLEAGELPEELSLIATSLRIVAGERFDRLAMAVEIRRALMDRAEELSEQGLASIVAELRGMDVTRGRRVLLSQRGGEDQEGVARGINGSGQLMVELDSGEQLSVQAGEVQFLRG